MKSFEEAFVSAMENLDLALQLDMEHGVRWLNEDASKEFAKKYPAVLAAIVHLREIEEKYCDD